MKRIKINSKKTIMALSFAISILLWSYVMGDINPLIAKQLLGLDVEIKGLENNGMVITSDIGSKVDVKISGRRNDIYEIRRNDLDFSVDLSGLDEGSHTAEVKLETDARTDNVNITYSPKEVEVILEKVVERSIGVEFQTIGDFPNGIDRSMISLQTKSVGIKGFRSKVESVSKVVANLTVSGIKEGQTFNVPLIAIDKNGNEVEGVDLEIETATVKVLGSEVKIAKVIPKLVGETPEGYKLVEVKSNPSEISFIKLDGGEVISEIETSEVDVSEITDSKEIETELLVPRGIELLDSSKIKLNFIIEKTESEVKEEEQNDEDEEEEKPENTEEKVFNYDISEVSMINIAENLEVTNTEDLPQQIEINLVGPIEELEGISIDEIKLEIDLSEVTEEGEHVVAINATGVEDGVTIKSLIPENMTLTVKEKSLD